MGLAVGNVPGEGARAGYRDQGVGRAVPEKGWHRIGCKIQPPCVADQHQVAVRAVAALAEGFLELEDGAWIVLACFGDAPVPFAHSREHLLFSRQRIPFSSDERRVGKEWVSTCRARWSQYI